MNKYITVVMEAILEEIIIEIFKMIWKRVKKKKRGKKTLGKKGKTSEEENFRGMLRSS